MAAKTQITNKGLELLASSSKATGQHWWIGWYALAFVPDEMQEEDKEKLGPNMTKLTENGDIIYNIFQGDMNGDGYQTTKASSKFKSVNYDSNIKKNYRYVLDDKGRNNLVAWVDGKKGLKGAYIYPGVSVSASQDEAEFKTDYSEIPIPAPLLYTGVKAAGEGWSVNGMDIFLGSGNDDITKFYPVDTVDGMIVPRVSTDFRNYEGYKNGLPKLDDGEQGYDYALNGTLDDVDFDGWFSSVNTYTQNDETDMGKDYNQYCRQYWKVLSISNFNKYCAPVNASGLLYDENTGCRNMAKATKYFPISDYSVTSTAKTADNEYATGIKLRVQLKLNGNAEDGAYFKDVEMGDAENVATLATTVDETQHALFNSQKVSFKFNRIGIYAVPMRQYGCSEDSGEMKAQYQIDTEAEPVLFAVCEWDSPVTLSDSGEGLSEFQSDIFVDLSAAVDDSSVIRESAVFYNLYEDDAIDWYKNQLVANAAMGEALINMQIEMGYLRDQKNAKGCCPKSEEIKQNNKSYTGLRNLVDADDYNSNSVRNRLAAEEGKALNAMYSDSIPHFGGIGYPQTTSSQSLLARETVGSGSSQDLYTAFYGSKPNSALMPTYSDAVFNGMSYADMVPSINTDGETAAARIGKLWIRTKFYYELYSLYKSRVQPSDFSADDAYDYPSLSDQSSETNNFSVGIVDLTNYFGNGADSRNLPSDKPHVTITKKPNNVIEVIDGETPSTTLPTDLPSDLVADITSQSFVDYEVHDASKCVYTAYYDDDTTPRNFTDYKYKKTVTLKIPKIQLYKISTSVYTTINNHLQSTGWRIPTTADWNEIMDMATPDKMQKIRSSTKWAGMVGGIGSIYPIGGAATGRGGTSVRTTSPDGSKQVVYLAIADDDTNVVMFDGFEFSKIPTPNFQDTESGLSYVAIICVADAVKIFDGISKYKLGYDSYALMEGSASAGDHNLNAGQNSIISETAHYNSIFGGMNNTVNDSSHNAILNGFSNEIVGAVHSVVFGDTNSLKSNGSVSCRALLAATKTTATCAVTSAIFAESSKLETIYQSSIMGDSLDVQKVYCSSIVGQYTTETRGIYYSDLITKNIYHLPLMYMSRAVLTDDHYSNLPSDVEYDSGVNIYYSELLGYELNFLKKKGVDGASSQVVESHISVGGTATGIISSDIRHSEIFAYGDASYSNLNWDNKSWFRLKTLESVDSEFSDIKLYDSSIASNYVDASVPKSYVRFSDISLGYSIMVMSDTGRSCAFNYGVMKLSESGIELCDCSYVYETGTQHYLKNSTINYATLVGKTLSLSNSTFKNVHIYGSLSLASSLSNHLILSGLDGTYVGNGFAASNYISEFGSYIVANDKGYPMIWSMGGFGMYMNKMILGDRGVSGSSEPHIGDVLTVVGVEGNVATVAWRPGGSAGQFGTVHLELEFDFSHSSEPHRGDGDDYAKNPWQYLTQGSTSINVNGNNVTPGESAITTMNSYMPDDIKFKVDNDQLVLENTSGTDSYMINGSARCDKVVYAIDEPGSGYPWGWKIWDTDAFYPYSLGDANSPCQYSASLTAQTVSPGGLYTDVVRSIAFGYTTNATATGGSATSGDICSAEVGNLPQHLVCKWIVDISYRKA